MKVLTTLLFSFFFAPVVAQNYNENIVETKREFVSEIDSKELGEKREIKIYLPEKYDVTEDANFPVLYLLDGQNLSESTLDIYKFLSSKQYIPEMIIVSIPHTSQRGRDYYAFKRGTDKLNEGVDNFMGFIKKELIPLINDKYRCSQFKIIAGHSSSGLFTIHALISEPTLFNAYFAFSPSIHHTPQIIGLLNEALKKNDLEQHYFFANVGGAEFYKIKAAFTQAKEVIQNNQQSGLRFDMELSEIDGHRSTPFIGMYRALEKLYHPIRFNEADYLDKTPNEIIRHFEKYSDMFGFPAQPEESQLLSKGRYFFSFDTKEHDLEVAQTIYQVADHYYPNSKASPLLGFINKWQEYGAKSGIAYDDSEIPNESSLNSFGYFLLNSKKMEEALFVFSLVIEHYPNSANAYDSLGEAYEKDGQHRKALKMFKKAHTLAEASGNMDNLKYYVKNIDRIKSKLKD